MNQVLHSMIDYIGRTNLFNFIIFAGIIAYVAKKLDAKSKIESAVVMVNKTIKESESTKVESELKLSDIQNKLNKISEEIDLIIKHAENNANIVGEKIIGDTEKLSNIIHENTLKTIENNKLSLKNDIMKRVSLASVEVAKYHIQEELNRNPELHSKLIEESISTLEGIKL